MNILIHLYLKLISSAPFLEVLTKIIYWKNYYYFKKFVVKHNTPKSNPINFDKIIENIKNRGIKKGDIIIVHSSYDLLSSSGLTPDKINNKLLELVGNDGTLVMPVIRKFDKINNNNYLYSNYENTTSIYDVNKTIVTSGLLPYFLMKKENSSISRCPLNPVVAVGKYAFEIVKDNINTDFITPHGKKSAWYFCAQNNATVIGLGIDLVHNLTLIHVNEECREDWPIKNWYRKRSFEVRDKSFNKKIEVFERKPIWGAFYFAERKLKKDLLSNKILKIQKVENIDISIVKSSDLFEFLKKNKNKTYPYYIYKLFKIFH